MFNEDDMQEILREMLNGFRISYLETEFNTGDWTDKIITVGLVREDDNNGEE